MISDLEDWFACQCDGDWAHQGGIRIETTDNPGWFVQVDLKCLDKVAQYRGTFSYRALLSLFVNFVLECFKKLPPIAGIFYIDRNSLTLICRQMHLRGRR